MRLLKGKDRALLALAIGLGMVNAAASAFVAVLLQQVLDVAVNGDGIGFWRLCRVMAVYVLTLTVLSFAEAWRESCCCEGRHSISAHRCFVALCAGGRRLSIRKIRRHICPRWSMM